MRIPSVAMMYIKLLKWKKRNVPQVCNAKCWSLCYFIIIITDAVWGQTEDHYPVRTSAPNTVRIPQLSHIIGMYNIISNDSKGRSDYNLFQCLYGHLTIFWRQTWTIVKLSFKLPLRWCMYDVLRGREGGCGKRLLKQHIVLQTLPIWSLNIDFERWKF